jgi:hypothetical protein
VAGGAGEIKVKCHSRRADRVVASLHLSPRIPLPIPEGSHTNFDFFSFSDFHSSMDIQVNRGGNVYGYNVAGVP